ncbi:class I SAM-dependent methyltransferase [Dyella japonica]|uniref:Trans-aconitate methyltransferase n=1 Tax=Dyella japonica TaxID=231455 RepID=A0ABV2K2L5_9GAMM
MTCKTDQQWDPVAYERHGRFVSDLGTPVLDLLQAAEGERILDLGCGDGALTLKIAGRGCDVLGVDSSLPMVEAARARGLDAEVMDGQMLAFDQPFDAVFSNAALHWMPKAEQVIDGIWKALKPGGRFVAEFGGHGNIATIAGALEAALAARGLRIPRPWFFPTPERYNALLKKRGFIVDFLALVPRRTALPGDAGDWLSTFAQPFIMEVSDDERPAFIAALLEELRPVMCDDKGTWWADYVRVRCRASKPR